MMFGKKKMIVKTYSTGSAVGCLGIFLPRWSAEDKFRGDVGKMARKGYVVASQSQNSWNGRLTVTYKLEAPGRG